MNVEAQITTKQCIGLLQIYGVVWDSESLRTGRSEDRIPMQARFSALVQTGQEGRPAFCTMGTGCLRDNEVGLWC